MSNDHVEVWQATHPLQRSGAVVLAGILDQCNEVGVIGSQHELFSLGVPSSLEVLRLKVFAGFGAVQDDESPEWDWSRMEKLLTAKTSDATRGIISDGIAKYLGIMTTRIVDEIMETPERFTCGIDDYRIATFFFTVAARTLNTATAGSRMLETGFIEQAVPENPETLIPEKSGFQSFIRAANLFCTALDAYGEMMGATLFNCHNMPELPGIVVEELRKLDRKLRQGMAWISSAIDCWPEVLDGES